MIRQLAAPGACGAEIWDEGQAVALHPREAELVADSAERRRRDFTLGRACARAALAQLGHPDSVLLAGADGAPVWPEGTVGSITHTTGYAAALVGPREKFSGLGLDAERVGGVTAELHGRLFDDAERAWLAGQGDAATAATRLFCAKEAGIKAWRPATGRPLSFRDIHIDVQGDGFAAAVKDGPGPAAGRFALHDGLVLAVLYLPAA